MQKMYFGLYEISYYFNLTNICMKVSVALLAEKVNRDENILKYENELIDLLHKLL